MARNADKALKVMELLNKDPSYADEYIAAKVGCHRNYVYKLRKKMAHAAAELENEIFVGKVEDITYDDLAELTYNVTRGKRGRRAGAENEIDAILTERGSRYGSFRDHAEITYALKMTAVDFAHKKGTQLQCDQAEALDMIFHKIGRILNGDPNYADSWVDIAGYAKLVADRLQGVER